MIYGRHKETQTPLSLPDVENKKLIKKTNEMQRDIGTLKDFSGSNTLLKNFVPLLGAHAENLEAKREVGFHFYDSE